jgi:hypothetical protein
MRSPTHTASAYLERSYPISSAEATGAVQDWRENILFNILQRKPQAFKVMASFGEYDENPNIFIKEVQKWSSDHQPLSCIYVVKLVMLEMRIELKVSVHYVPHEDEADGHYDKI